MRIRLALFATLTGYLPESVEASTDSTHERTIDLPDGTSIGQVISSLGLPNEPRVVFVNGRHAADDHVLVDGERLAVFPPVAGG
ncbi:MAG: MoaD/ThiS family protein [Coriobacteriia bacterium]